MRIAVIGAGIVGLAVARRLSERAQVTVLDKEDRVGAHQTSHNSGVVHAGLYYQPGSLKAELCRRGRTLLAGYCRERGLPYEMCGKLVVARDRREAELMTEIERRSIANQVPGLRRLDAEEIRAVEPHARGVAALHSPETAITDFAAVARSYAEDVQKAGGEIRLATEVTRIDGTAVNGEGFDLVVVCAGLHADRVSRLAGDGAEPQIVPFRGEYYQLKAERTGLVRGLIYPVPDPRYPFLGIHLTRTVRGTVEVGPNAVFAAAREGYSWRRVRAGDLAESLRWPGFRTMARKHWRTGLLEMHGSLSRRAFVARAATYVPELTPADVERAGAGVRAQAVDADGSLVDDFRIHRIGKVVTVRNAPSPAATSSLAIGEYVAAKVLDRE
jgi:L-2-hydroxyglutarate oxidase LhgO